MDGSLYKYSFNLEGSCVRDSYEAYLDISDNQMWPAHTIQHVLDTCDLIFLNLNYEREPYIALQSIFTEPVMIFCLWRHARN